MLVNTDCIYFKGDIPCSPNKKEGYVCEDCPVYKKISKRILIIKLGAIGDVIRTTPVLRKLREIEPNAFITWLTYSPEILSKDYVNRILKVTVENIELLKQSEFDIIYNFDKDPIAISLTNAIKSGEKKGFSIDSFGHAKPISSVAEEQKWLTGLFDSVSKENKKHYIQEMFDIAGFEFNSEEYILEPDAKFKKEWDINKNKKVIGLNTGCGGRWKSRLWPNDYWVKLAQKLIEDGYEVVLLGGEQEDLKNKQISEASGAKYFGFDILPVFMHLMNECDLVITAVTMGMHLAIGLKKKVIIFNNIFNKNEFYLYNRGVILEPDYECNYYFVQECPNNCMQYLYPEKVVESVKLLMSK